MFFADLYPLLPLKFKNSLMTAGHRFLKPGIKKHFSSFIKPNDLVFDVGAHIGIYTELFLELGARVVAIDPQPYCIKVLEKKFLKNPKVKIVGKGLSNREGWLDFYISKNAPDNSTFYSNWLKHPRLRKSHWEEKIKVPVTTLEALVEEYGSPKFCKIDVEGYELQVMQGLKTKIPAISYEFDQEFMELSHSCAKYLDSLGKLRFNYSLYIPLKLDSENWLTYEQLVEKLEEKKNGYLRGDVIAKFS